MAHLVRPVTVRAALTVPVQHRADVGLYFAMAACLAIGFVTSLLYRGHTIVRTHSVNVSIAQQYGKPSASVPGAQVNASFKGLTCLVYQSKKTVICAP